MNRYPEHIDPHDPESASLFVRVEHLARYLFAAEFVRKRKLKKVLDCACGSGYGSIVLAAKAESVTAIDRNSRLIEQGMTNCSAKGIGNIAFHEADLNDGLGVYTDGSFDCVACFETLEHVEQDERLLMEYARVLRRGRWLLVSAPKAGYEGTNPDGRPENPWHLRLYEPKALKELLARCGFAVERELGQPYANMLRANDESFRRDSTTPRDALNGFFSNSPDALEYYARLWAWPTAEMPEKSNVILLVCRKK